MSQKEHWENIYATKQPNEVSWTREIPSTSLEMIRKANIDKSAAIIDVGGGDGNLVDHLLEEGYTNITVLDISRNALQRAKERLGDKAEQVKWIETNILDFKPESNYALWHDRAVFHFLTEQKHIHAYSKLVEDSVSGHLLLATFSATGPKKCSGLEITQYSEEKMDILFGEAFERLDSFAEEHQTPFDTVQNFLWCHYRRK